MGAVKWRLGVPDDVLFQISRVLVIKGCVSVSDKAKQSLFRKMCLKSMFCRSKTGWPCIQQVIINRITQ